MKQRDIKLTLHAHLQEITGCGDSMQFKVRGHRTTKAGTVERYELDLEVCRWGVTHILRELQKMHARDRARIQRELDRIRKESVLLTQEPPAQ